MKIIVSAIKYILFWMLVFTIQRILFFIFYFDRFIEISFKEQFSIFIHGLRLDLSMSGYFLLIPIVFLILQFIFQQRNLLFEKLISLYTSILLIIVILFGLIDIGIYKEWGVKLNSRAIEFLVLSPAEAIASSSSSPVVKLSILFVIQFVLFIYLYKKYFKYTFEKHFIYLTQISLILVLAFSSVMMMRGGLQLAPINQSAVYFSRHNIVNHASLNTEWNLMHSIIENHFSTENPYVFMDESKAKVLVDSLYNYPLVDTNSILKTTKPNIVFIILESFTSDVVEYFGGDEGVAPNLSKLAAEGLSFENIYASGDRTDKGMIAILSGFPTQAVRTIIQQPDKFEKLPSLPNTLGNIGYNNSFFYGGESEFSNFKSYLLSSGITKIIDKNDFEKSQMNSKWGAHDGYLFDKVLKEFSAEKEPFFSVVLTLSSHEPFEIPVSSPYNGNDLPSKFRKAAHYTDQCIATFFEQAKQQDWYKNTLFVIVADHGHRLPREYNNAYDVLKFRIPLIFYGDVIKEQYRSTKISKIGSQTDIAKTLLTQLNINDTTYKWSKDLLNAIAPSFAFYTYDNGIGWVDENNNYTMDNVTKQETSRKNKTDKADKNMLLGKAYMQKVFAQYLNY